MPQRLASLAVAVVGVLVVVGLLLLGRDLGAAASCPRWRRRLIGAGLLLLASLGVGVAQGAGDRRSAATRSDETAPRAEAAEAASPAGDLAARPDWQKLTSAWREAEEVGSGQRGPYPFDSRGKQELLRSLDTAAESVTRLQREGLLSDAEAGMLTKDLVRLATGVQAKRTTEERLATCYEPMALVAERESLSRLADRLPLLEKIAASGTLRPAVLSRVLAIVEEDLATLARPAALAKLPADEARKAEALRKDVTALVRKIQMRLGGAAGLEESPDWKALLAAWDEARPLALTGKSTEKQRESAKQALLAAKEAAGRLAAAGLLSYPESRLLGLEADTLQKEIYRNPPTDIGIMCYLMAFLPPAQESLDSMAARLPLLLQLAESGKVHRSVLGKIISTIEHDMSTLSDGAKLRDLSPDERARAEEARREVEQALVRIKPLLTSR